jgi:hypothetical protein
MGTDNHFEGGFGIVKLKNAAAMFAPFPFCRQRLFPEIPRYAFEEFERNRRRRSSLFFFMCELYFVS